MVDLRNRSPILITDSALDHEGHARNWNAVHTTLGYTAWRTWRSRFAAMLVR